MQAGPGCYTQIPADTKLSYLHKDFHAEYRKVQHKGMIDERRSWCKNYGYLHHHFFYPEGRAIIGGASSSSNMLTGYILFTQARPAEISSAAYMVPCYAAQWRFEEFSHTQIFTVLQCLILPVFGTFPTPEMPLIYLIKTGSMQGSRCAAPIFCFILWRKDKVWYWCYAKPKSHPLIKAKLPRLYLTFCTESIR